MKKILVIRHDKIGDFVLTWPALYLLKTAYPEAEIDVFIAPIMKEFALRCPYIDNIIIDNGDDDAISTEIHKNNYDAAIVALSRYRIYKILKPCNIPYMLVPKVGWYQYFYTYRVDHSFDRAKPMRRASCKLVDHFLTTHNVNIPELPKKLWNVDSEKDKWRKYYHQQGNEKLIFVHAGTGGSSGAVAENDLATLVQAINAKTKVDCRFILTFGKNEIVIAERIMSTLSNTEIKIELATPLDNLADFAESIVAADIFIAGSTGPIHIAGLHNVPTVGFYAGRRSAPHIRWQTLTEESKRLHFMPPIGRKTGRDMSLINFKQAAEDISSLLDRLYIKN